jgi:hypothetical protein
MSSKYDIAIAYRVYPGVSKTPFVFADNKLSLVALGLRSFKKALGSLRAKIWVLLDDCPPAYRDLFQAHFPAADLEIIDLPGVGNAQTFLKQIQILSDQTDAENVYFAEDDYYYLSDAMPVMIDFLRANPDADFVTPYDHMDYYTHTLHRMSHEIRWHNDRHWRTAGSTCLTFLTTRGSLRKTRPIFETYARGNNDASMWMSLTKRGPGLFSPFQIVKDFHVIPGVPKFFVDVWRYGWRQMLLGERRNLWAPLPSLGTHMESAHLAPGIDWERLAGMDADLSALDVPLRE